MYTPTNVLQYNEYYPFGLQTQNSWTRSGVGNNFLYNEASELNSATKMYDLPFRNYDAALGRFFQVDALALVDPSSSTFAYAGNNPVGFNDPSGLTKADPDGFKSRNYWAAYDAGTDGILTHWWDDFSIDGGGGAPFPTTNWSAYWASVLASSPEGTTIYVNTGDSFKSGTLEFSYSDKGYWIDYADNGSVNAEGEAQVESKRSRFIRAGFAWGYNASPGDPSYAHAGEFGGTLAEFSALYKGWTLEQVQNEMNAKGKFNSQPGGPGKIRYVEDPLNKGKYIDMRHMLVVGYKWGQAAGLGIEIWQLIAFPASAMNKQDFYSNELGDHFEQMFPSHLSGSTSFVDQLNTFLNSKYYREDFSRVVK